MRYGDFTEQDLDLRLGLVVPHRSLMRMLCSPPQRAQRMAAYHTLARQLGRAEGERPPPYQVVLIAPAAGEEGDPPGGDPLPLELGQGLPEMAGGQESPPGAVKPAPATAAAAAGASPAALGLAPKGEEAATGPAAVAATPGRVGRRAVPASPQLFTPAAVRLRAAVEFAIRGAVQE